MHGNENFGVDLLCHAGSLFWVDGKVPTYRDEEKIHRTDLSQFFLAQDVAEVA